MSVIEIRRANGLVYAELKGRPSIQANGLTTYEAVGRLVVNYPHSIGIDTQVVELPAVEKEAPCSS